MLVQVRRLLRPGGEVWISCPNADSLWRRVFGRGWVNWHVPFHLWHFAAHHEKGPGPGRFPAGGDQSAALWLAQSVCISRGSGLGPIG
jgi:hypothetical protein